MLGVTERDVPLGDTALPSQFCRTTSHPQRRFTACRIVERHIVEVERAESDTECFHRCFAHRESSSQRGGRIGATRSEITFGIGEDPPGEAR